MAKLPYFPFYPGDWMQDTRSLSLATKGAWIDILCGLWRSQTRGTLTLPVLGWARLIGATVDQAEQVIEELVKMRICDSVTDRNKEVTITNRRMVREEKERISNTERQKRHRDKFSNGENNGKVTPYISYSSSISEKQKDPPASPLPKSPYKIDLKAVVVCDLDEPAKHKLYNQVVRVFQVRGWDIDKLPLRAFQTVAESVTKIRPRETFPYFMKSLEKHCNENAEIYAAQTKIENKRPATVSLVGKIMAEMR